MPPATVAGPRQARRAARRIDFLFDPQQVNALLDRLPHVREELERRRQRTVPAKSIPGIRRSSRQLYRVLGNPHYPHLLELLQALDACLAAGFVQPTVLTTRSRKPFSEALTELRAADHFRSCGFSIADLNTVKGNDSTADLLVAGAGLQAVIEAYCPTAWPELSDYNQRVTLRIKNLDVNRGFKARITHAPLVEQDPATAQLRWLDQPSLCAGLDEQTRLETADDLSDRFSRLLRGQTDEPARVALPHINLSTTITYENIAPLPTTGLPPRFISIDYASLVGCRPEAIFARIVERAIEEKLTKGQALRVVPGALPILLVDLEASDVANTLDNPHYRQLFAQILDDKLTDLHGYAALIFFERGSWGRRLRPHFSRFEAALTDQATLDLLFPRRGNSGVSQ